MQLQFAYPLVLLLALVLGVHTLWLARRLTLLSRGRRIVSVALRLLVIALLVCGLAGMRVARLSKDLTTMFVLDQSDSVPQKQRDFAKLFIKKAVKEQGVDDRHGVVVFGADAAVEQAPNRDTDLDAVRAVIASARTNIADALQLALACFTGQSQKRIVLLSDGNQNAGDAAEIARTAAAAGVTIDVLPLRYENRNDVILEKVVIEERVSVDKPFDIKIIASTRQGTTGKLSIMQDGKVVGHDEVELKEGVKKNVFQVRAQVHDPGFHNFEVQLDAQGDSIPENNRGYAFTYVGGEPRVLLVDGDQKPSPVLGAMLLAEKIKVEAVRPDSIPHALRDLQGYDAVIFNNVHAGDVTTDQMQIIERAEHDLGVGFMMIGGENSFGSGGWNDSPIERILPVEMEIKNEKILPKGALVPIIHTIEIPDGQFWSTQICEAALDVLSPQDEMGLLYYSWNGGESWLFPLQPVGDKSRMHSLIKNIQPGDMPSFDTTLEMAWQALSASTASVKHIVIISDGDPQTPNQALARKLVAAHITISTVCINPHSQRDVDVMKDLAAFAGGNFYEVTSFNKLPQIFIKEAATVAKSLLIEEPFNPVTKAYSPVLKGLGPAYPQLKGYVATSPKPMIDLPLVTHKGDPLLAFWNHGVGKTLAFTSDAKERWAPAWTGWGQYSKFWSQAVRSILRSPFNRNYQVRMDIDGTKGHVTVDAVDDAGQFRNFLQIAGTVITPSLKSVPLAMRQTSPGRYEADFEATEPGTYMMGASSGKTAGASAGAGAESGGSDLLTAGTTMSFSPEFQNSKSNEPLLYRLADLTHGRVLDEKSQVFVHNRQTYAEPRPLWPALFMWAIFLFLLDVFVRRVMVGWDEVAAGWRRGWGWIVAKLTPKPALASGPAEQLLEVKKEVRATRTGAGGEAMGGGGGVGEGATPEAFQEMLKNVKVTGSPTGQTGREGGGKPLDIKKPEEPKKKEPEAEAGFTGQLLKARKDAQARQIRRKDQP